MPALNANKKNKPVVVLGVCGSIAAYKTCELIRMLSESQIETHVIMTQNATRFIGKITFEALSNNPVFSTEWDDGMLHIEMKNRADVFAIVPATANMIGKMANGIADDVVSSTYLAMQVPVVVAPAMNPGMFNHPALQRNIEVLKKDGVQIIDPENGVVICGDEGQGKLASTKQIHSTILNTLKIKK